MAKGLTTEELDRLEQQASSGRGLTTAQLDAMESASMDLSPVESAALQNIASPRPSKYQSPGIDVYGPQDTMGPGSSQTWQQFNRGAGPQMLGETAMGTMGAILGTAIGGPAGGVAGGALGAALGAGLGKEAQMNELGVTGPRKRMEIEQAAKWAFLGDVVGGVIGTGVGKLIGGGIARRDMVPGVARLSRKLSDAAKRVKGADLPPRARDIARRGGAFITAAQASKNPIVDTLESVGERSYTGGGNLYQVKRIVNPRAYRQLIAETASDFWDEAGGVMGTEEVADMFVNGMTSRGDAFRLAFAKKLTRGLNAIPDSKIGDTVGDALNASRDAWRKAGSAKYAAVDNLLKEKGSPITITRMVPSKVLDSSGQPVMQQVTEQTWDIVPTDKIKRLATQLGKEAEVGKGLGASGSIMSISERIASEPDRLSFAQADDLRSFILEEGRKIDTALGSKSPRVSRTVNELQEAINASMMKAAQQQSPEVGQALSEARSFWRSNSQLYGTPFVQRMAKLAESDSPAKLADYIFTRKAPERVVLAKRVLGDETFNQVRDTWLQNAVHKSLDNSKSIGTALRKQLDYLGDETLDAAFGAAQKKDLYAIADIFSREGRNSFENQMIRSAVKYAENKPSAFVRRIFDPKNVEGLRRYKRILPKQDMDKLRALWVQDALERGAREGGTNAIGETVNTFDEILAGLGTKMRREMFTDAHYKNLRDIARLGRLLGEPTGGGGGILAPLMEAGAVAGLVTSPSRAARSSMSVLGTLTMLGRIMGNEKSAMWLARGMKEIKVGNRSLSRKQAMLFAQRAVAELVRDATRPSTGSEPRTSYPERPVGGHHF